MNVPADQNYTQRFYQRINLIVALSEWFLHGNPPDSVPKFKWGFPGFRIRTKSGGRILLRIYRGMQFGLTQQSAANYLDFDTSTGVPR